MSDDRPVVAVWAPQSDGTYVKAAQVGAYSTLAFTPTYCDAGSWAMTIPYDTAALALTPGRLVTIDWRGVRSTWLIEGLRFFQQPSVDGGEPGSPQVEVSGGGALAILGWCLCWPDATKAIEVQPLWRLKDPAPYIGAAETVLVQLIAANLRDRYGLNIAMPPSQGLGGTIRVRPVFDNLFELARGKARYPGQIGLDVVLVNTDQTHAQLSMRFWQPADVSASVRLSTKMKTVSSWEQNDTAPTATKAFVGTGDGKANRTTLAADVTDTATSITVASSDDFPAPDTTTPSFRVTIGNESLSVTAISGKTWTVTRGYGSTTAASHNSGDRVSLARTFTVVTGPTSSAAAAAWGGHREVYIDGPSTKDNNEIVDSGIAALSDGAETRTLTVESAEPVGMRAFTHYQVGDIATAEVATGATATDNISAIAVTVDTSSSSGITVVPVFGDPSRTSSSLRIADLIRGLRRDVRRMERE